MELKCNKGFTLAEVLITLVIIGVVAAITIPVINSGVNRNVLNSQFKKTYSTLTNAVNKTIFDNGTIPECYYPIDGLSATDNISECSQFFKDFTAHLVLAKKCESNSYQNGCVPDYQWPSMTGCEGFDVEAIKSHSSYILNDGSIIFFYADGIAPLIGFDVNGLKKPNKPGFDVYAMRLIYEENKSRLLLKGPGSYVIDCLPDMGGANHLSEIMGK